MIKGIMPLYKIFEQLFPETNYDNDKDFYRKIAVYCLGAESSDKTGGEYKVNLKNDYDDTTQEDAKKVTAENTSIESRFKETKKDVIIESKWIPNIEGPYCTTIIIKEVK